MYHGQSKLFIIDYCLNTLNTPSLFAKCCSLNCPKVPWESLNDYPISLWVATANPWSKV